MDRDFEITTGPDGLPTQTFNGKTYKLWPNKRYFTRRQSITMHTEVWETFNGKKPKGFHIHHKDNNPWNNKIENLELVEAKRHLSEHIKKRINEDKEWFSEFHKKGIEAAKQWHSSPEGKEWHSELGKLSWKGREYKILICQQCGKEYETRHNGISKFCHNNCKAKALRASR